MQVLDDDQETSRVRCINDRVGQPHELRETSGSQPVGGWPEIYAGTKRLVHPW